MHILLWNIFSEFLVSDLYFFIKNHTSYLYLHYCLHSDECSELPYIIIDFDLSAANFQLGIRPIAEHGPCCRMLSV